MALLISLLKTQHVARNLAVIVCPKLLKYMCTDRTITLEVDALDDFTSQLIQKKTIKWDNCKFKTNLKLENLNCNDDFKINVDIQQITHEELNLMFNKAIEECNDKYIICLMKECIKFKVCPETTILFYVLTQCSRYGDKETIFGLRQLYRDIQPKILIANSNFTHFLAYATWVKGNIKNSLRLFEEVYRDNVYLRRRIRVMLRHLINNVTSHHSEAVLVSIIEFCEKISNDFKDNFFLSYIWRTCFISEWYSDQCIALELLERNNSLRKAVSNQIPYVVGISLKNHQIEIIYRLLEVFLKYSMTMQIPTVLLPLFDFQVQKGDLRSCYEIIQWSSKNNVVLPTIIHERFLKLVAGQDNKFVKEEKNTAKDTSKYTFKF